MPFDIGIGLLLGIGLNQLTGIAYPLCLLAGVIACLLPDLDFIWDLAKGRKPRELDQKGFHRDGLHYPLLFIPLVVAFGMIFNIWVGILFGLGAFIHFLHDSIGVGWGVKWLYPFNKNSYMFLYIAGVPTNKEMQRRLFYSFDDKEREILIARYGDPNWIKHIYFQPHIFGLVEYAVFIVSLFVTLRH